MRSDTTCPSTPWRRATSQPRSTDTAQRILDEALRRFAAGTLETSPVAEIARAAGVSVGGFYGRYRTKSDLQRAVVQTLMDEHLAPFRELLDPEALRGTGAGERVRRYARALVNTFGGERDVLRRLVLLVRSDPSLPYSAPIRALNRDVQERWTRALLDCRDEIGHPDPEAALQLVELTISAAAREALLHAGTGVALTDEQRATLVDELCDLACRYLRIPAPDTREPTCR